MLDMRKCIYAYIYARGVIYELQWVVLPHSGGMGRIRY